MENGKPIQVQGFQDSKKTAFRFAHAGSIISSAQSSHIEKNHQPNMLIAEVKERYAKENRNMYQKDALKSVLTRFGCCPSEEFHDLYDTFSLTGISELSSCHVLRSVVFGGKVPLGKKSIVSEFISLKHVVNYLNLYIENHWDYFKTANFRDPTLSFLVTLKKASFT